MLQKPAGDCRPSTNASEWKFGLISYFIGGKCIVQKDYLDEGQSHQQSGWLIHVYFEPIDFEDRPFIADVCFRCGSHRREIISVLLKSKCFFGHIRTNEKAGRMIISARIRKMLCELDLSKPSGSRQFVLQNFESQVEESLIFYVNTAKLSTLGGDLFKKWKHEEDLDLSTTTEHMENSMIELLMEATAKYDDIIVLRHAVDKLIALAQKYRMHKLMRGVEDFLSETKLMNWDEKILLALQYRMSPLYVQVQRKYLLTPWNILCRIQRLFISNYARYELPDSANPYSQLHKNLLEMILEKLDYFAVRDRITHVIVTHGHLDHCANLGLFPNAMHIMDSDISIRCNGKNEYSVVPHWPFGISENVEIMKLSGHTASDTIVIARDQFKKTVVFSGDLMEEGSNEDGLQGSCAICLVQFRMRDKISALICGHMYHHGCINQWIAAKRQCPNCRKTIPRSGYVEKLYFLKEGESKVSDEIDYMEEAHKLTAEIRIVKEKNEKLQDENKNLKTSIKALEKKIIREKEKSSKEIPMLKATIEALKANAEETDYYKEELEVANTKIKACDFYKLLTSQTESADKKLREYLRDSKRLDVEKFIDLIKTQNHGLTEVRRDLTKKNNTMRTEIQGYEKTIKDQEDVIKTLKEALREAEYNQTGKIVANKLLKSILMEETPNKRISMGFDETKVPTDDLSFFTKENNYDDVKPGSSGYNEKPGGFTFGDDDDDAEKKEKNKVSKNGREESSDFPDIPVPDAIINRISLNAQSSSKLSIQPQKLKNNPISLKRQLSFDSKPGKTNSSMIDVHCHLADNKFKEDLDEVIAQAIHGGIKKMIVVPEFESQFEKVIEICQRFPGKVYGGIGIHPIQKRGKCVRMKNIAKVEQYLVENEKYVVCVGEVGLDHTKSQFKLTDADLEEQCRVFKQQIEIAKHFNKTLNVHSRSVARKTIQVLQEANVPKDHAILHAFDGTNEDAKLGIEQGYLFSIPPSFSSDHSKQIIKSIPLHLLLLETDSPALGPVKGVKNVPENCQISARIISEAKKIPLEEVISATSSNAYRVFQFPNEIHDTVLTS
ncbi:unnamed protein product [Caenorhabditis sp. 36 PRJEB53466]|nr:unnamed protein product [Caenorhabditis sp. 36 PRJEB53466]